MTPFRNAWAWTRLPIRRPCMSVIATIRVSIRPLRTIACSSWSRGWSAPPWWAPWSLWVAVVIRASSAALRGAEPLARALLRGHPAVGNEHAAGDERRLVRGQEERDVGDLPRLPGPADRLEGVDRRIDLLEPAEHLDMGVVDRRVDPPGRDRVAADVLLGVIEGDPLAEHDDRALGRGVDGQERLGDQAVDGARVDEGAAARAEHVRDRVAAPIDAALDVDVQGPIDDFVRHFVEHAGDVDAGVVEHGVEAAPPLDGRVRVGLDLARVGHVGRDRVRGFADRRRGLLDG